MTIENEIIKDEKLHLDKTWIIAGDLIFQTYSYGSVVKKEWLMSHFKLVEPKLGNAKTFEKFAFRYMECVEGLKKYMLEEYQMLLISKRGEGYLIVLPEHQVEVAMDTLKKSVITEINRAVHTLQNINESRISLNSKRERDEAIGKIAALTAFSRKSFRLSKSNQEKNHNQN